ncbi:MAG: cytochrome c [Rhizobiales bacterium]|nr:cytochrome c [Hyphomicrobiales bacterium]
MTRILIAIAAILGGIAAFVFSGVYDVGADTPHWPITRKIIEVMRDRAIAVRASDIRVPDLSSDQLILKGAGQYAAMCVGCHLAPDTAESEIRPGLYPQPPNLSKHALDPQTVFWVTKHGLKMSGMPAWGLGHDDATIWSIVAFVQKLPGMSPQQYKDIVAKAPPDEEMKAVDGKADEHGHEHGAAPANKSNPGAGHSH